MKRISREEDFLLFCDFLLVGNGWLTTVGLVLDIVGFVIIICGSLDLISMQERADNHEENAQIQQRAENQEIARVGGPNPQSKIHLDRVVVNKSKSRELKLLGRNLEKRSAAIGAAFIILGFALQIVGSWPCSLRQVI